MSLTRILSVFFFLIALVLAGFLVYRIKYKIDEDKRIARQEQLVINKLKMIRDAEVAFRAANGKYTGNWDTLINFIDTGYIYITQRNEKIIPKQYGQEDVIVTIDTIGRVNVKDSMFVVRERVPALAKGTITNLDVTQGSLVNKGDLLGTLQNEKGRILRIKAPTTGSVDTVYVREGSQVEPTTSITRLRYKRIENVANLPYIPGSKTGKKFELWAGKVAKGNVVADVFEAKDTDPVNPARRKNNMENALRVGSKTDVSTSGNWE